MKKRFVNLFLVIVLLISISMPTIAADSISVEVDGKAVVFTDAMPFIDANGRTMVPLRPIAEAMDMDVKWDEAAREAIFFTKPYSIINSYTPDEYVMDMIADGVPVDENNIASIIFREIKITDETVELEALTNKFSNISEFQENLIDLKVEGTNYPVFTDIEVTSIKSEPDMPYEFEFKVTLTSNSAYSFVTFPIGSKNAYKTEIITDTTMDIPMDTEAVIVNDRIYAPVRYLAEVAGYEVGWDDVRKTVRLTTYIG